MLADPNHTTAAIMAVANEIQNSALSAMDNQRNMSEYSTKPNVENHR
jgi:hypothetical protein